MKICLWQYFQFINSQKCPFSPSPLRLFLIFYLIHWIWSYNFINYSTIQAMMKNLIIMNLSIGTYILHTFTVFLSCRLQVFNKVKYILFIYLSEPDTHLIIMLKMVYQCIHRHFPWSFFYILVCQTLDIIYQHYIFLFLLRVKAVYSILQFYNPLCLHCTGQFHGALI